LPIQVADFFVSVQVWAESDGTTLLLVVGLYGNNIIKTLTPQKKNLKKVAEKFGSFKKMY
jgi:hypothetical protein